MPRAGRGAGTHGRRWSVRWRRVAAPELRGAEGLAAHGARPASAGRALWEAQQGATLLAAKRRLDPVQFEAMYQEPPTTVREGLLYGLNFTEYDDLPREIVRRANHTDTADTGDDYLCSISMRWMPTG